MTDFDKTVERRGTNCLKYDFSRERGYPEDVLPFWVADMDFPAPQPVIDELVKRSRHGIFGYTDLKEDYFAAVAHWFSIRHGWQPSRDSLTVTPGVVFAICTAIRAFTQPGDAVLINQPVYYPFSLSIKDNGRKPVDNTLVQHEGRYEIDFDDFEQKITANRVKLYLLCSPHNPVGRVWRRDELARLAAICQKHQVTVVADEIHADFVRPGFRHTVFASLSREAAEMTITCTAPSKTFNLAGLQISNIFIENPALRRKFRHELLASGYSQPNALGLFAARAAYVHGAGWLDELRDYLEQNLSRTKDFLARNLPKVKVIEPEGTYLLWLDFSDYQLSAAEIDERIIHRCKLWLDSGRIFGPSGESFQRLNLACPWSVLKEGLERLASFGQ